MPFTMTQMDLDGEGKHDPYDLDKAKADFLTTEAEYYGGDGGTHEGNCYIEMSELALRAIREVKRLRYEIQGMHEDAAGEDI